MEKSEEVQVVTAITGGFDPTFLYAVELFEKSDFGEPVWRKVYRRTHFTSLRHQSTENHTLRHVTLLYHLLFVHSHGIEGRKRCTRRSPFAHFNHRIKRRSTYGIRKCPRVRVYLDVTGAHGHRAIERKESKDPIAHDESDATESQNPLLCPLLVHQDDGLSVFV